MLGVLTFIFSNFWIWLGTLLLLEVVVEGAVKIFRPQRTISEKQFKKQVKAILEKNREKNKNAVR